jgi:hypothetical protein
MPDGNRVGGAIHRTLQTKWHGFGHSNNFDIRLRLKDRH